MKRAARFLTVIIAALFILGLPAFGQDPPAQEPAPTGGGGQRGAAQPRPPRPYEQVITKDAKTDEGMFDVHKVGETYYYEITGTADEASVIR